jgi:dihydrodipicolinate synthase/N-acetylneuraminate lyase
MVSAHATGATGFLSPLASVAPGLVRSLYDLVRVEDYKGAYAPQVEAALLHRLVNPAGVPGLKAAAAMMGRDAGPTRPPLPALDAAAGVALRDGMSKLARLGAEQRGW